MQPPCNPLIAPSKNTHSPSLPLASKRPPRWTNHDFSERRLTRTGLSTVLYPAQLQRRGKPSRDQLLPPMQDMWQGPCSVHKNNSHWSPASFNSWGNLTRSTYESLGALGSQLVDKFRVIPQEAVPTWLHKRDNLATMLGIEADDTEGLLMVENAMLINYPLRHTGIGNAANICPAGSPCMFLSKQATRSKAGDAAKYPVGEEGSNDYAERNDIRVVVPMTNGGSGVIFQRGKGYVSVALRVSIKKRLTTVPSAGKNPISVNAHALVLWALSGPPPNSNSIVAMHICDEKACVNPLHLTWATQSANRKGHAPEGAGGAGGSVAYQHMVTEAELV